MIVIDVEDYCQSCMNFQPDVTYPTRTFDYTTDGNEVETEVVMTNTIIRCKSRKFCKTLIRYLEHQRNKDQ